MPRAKTEQALAARRFCSLAKIAFLNLAKIAFLNGSPFRTSNDGRQRLVQRPFEACSSAARSPYRRKPIARAAVQSPRQSGFHQILQGTDAVDHGIGLPGRKGIERLSEIAKFLMGKPLGVEIFGARRSGNRREPRSEER